jgi:ATP-binding cassette subfamily C (CFTR/MRP) protein 1
MVNAERCMKVLEVP